MRRREFITLIGALAMAPPSTAFAQQSPGRMARIVYLGATGAAVLDPRQIEGFKHGLRESGLIEGRNVTVDYLWAEGDPARLLQLTGEVSRGGYDVIVTAGPQAVHALTRAGTTAPIVFAIVGDAIANGVVTSLARPTGNVTGLSMSNSDLESKRIEILKEAAPSVTRVMALRDPTIGAGGLQEAASTAKALGVEFDVVVAGVDQFDAAFADAVRRGVNGLATFASPFFNFHRARLIGSCQASSSAVDLGGCRLRQGWGPFVLWPEFRGHVSPFGRLCRQNPQWCKAIGLACRATCAI